MFVALRCCSLSSGYKNKSTKIDFIFSTDLKQWFFSEKNGLPPFKWQIFHLPVIFVRCCASSKQIYFRFSEGRALVFTMYIIILNVAKSKDCGALWSFTLYIFQLNVMPFTFGISLIMRRSSALFWIKSFMIKSSTSSE